MNESFTEKTVRLGCLASGVGAGCGLAFFATCASVGVGFARSAKPELGLWSMVISLGVAAVVVVLVFLLVRKNTELRLLREKMERKDG